MGMESAAAVAAIVCGDAGHAAVAAATGIAAAGVAAAGVAAAAVVPHSAAEQQDDQNDPQTVVIVVPHCCHLTFDALCYHMSGGDDGSLTT